MKNISSAEGKDEAPDGYHLAKLEVRCCLVEGGASN